MLIFRIIDFFAFHIVLNVYTSIKLDFDDTFIAIITDCHFE